MRNLEEILVENPVVAAIRNEADLKKCISSDVQVVFVLFGDIINIKDICEKLRKADKLVFIHIDMIEGLKGDYAGLQFIKTYAEPYGIITTKITNVKHAKQLGLGTIQRVFIIDSLSLDSGIRNIKEVMPDAVEVMPGVASKIINMLQSQVHVPVIAGGLIESKKDVLESLASGAVAISTSTAELWNI